MEANTPTQQDPSVADLEANQLGQEPFGQEEEATGQGPSANPAPAGAGSFADENNKPWEKIDAGTVVLGLLLLVGIGSVYFLKQRCGPAKASASEVATQTEVERALDGIRTIDPQAVQRTEQLVASFYYEPKRRQVRVDRIEENPFLLRLDPDLDKKLAARQGQDEVEPGQEEAAASRHGSAQQALTQAVQRLNSLSLQSTMVRPDGRSRALISDFVLNVGDSIQGWTIKEIRGDHVVLTWRRHQHRLSMPN
jgi:hypothetical protein